MIVVLSGSGKKIYSIAPACARARANARPLEPFSGIPLKRENSVRRWRERQIHVLSRFGVQSRNIINNNNSNIATKATSVWPDVWIKNTPILSTSCPKYLQQFLVKRWHFSKIPKSGQIFWPHMHEYLLERTFKNRPIWSHWQQQRIKRKYDNNNMAVAYTYWCPNCERVVET